MAVPEQHEYLLVGDVGGTFTRFMWCETAPLTPGVLKSRVPEEPKGGADVRANRHCAIIPNFKFAKLQDALTDFWNGKKEPHGIAVIAVPGAVVHQKVQTIVNIQHWGSLDAAEMYSILPGVKKYVYLNDFKAIGYGLLALRHDDDLETFALPPHIESLPAPPFTPTSAHAEKIEGDFDVFALTPPSVRRFLSAPKCCIGAGTGTGVVLVIPRVQEEEEDFIVPKAGEKKEEPEKKVAYMSDYTVTASEGGHSSFTPRTELEWGLLNYIQTQWHSETKEWAKMQRVSVERVVSGGYGIPYIYQYFASKYPAQVPKGLIEFLQEEEKEWLESSKKQQDAVKQFAAAQATQANVDDPYLYDDDDMYIGDERSPSFSPAAAIKYLHPLFKKAKFAEIIANFPKNRDEKRKKLAAQQAEKQSSSLSGLAQTQNPKSSVLTPPMSPQLSPATSPPSSSASSSSSSSAAAAAAVSKPPPPTSPPPSPAATQDEVLELTRKLLIGAYGAFAGDMAVVSLCFGGLYIAGNGHIRELLKEEKYKKIFMKRFIAKGRLKPNVMDKIPVYVVNKEVELGLLGAHVLALRLWLNEKKLNQPSSKS